MLLYLLIIIDYFKKLNFVLLFIKVVNFDQVNFWRFTIIKVDLPRKEFKKLIWQIFHQDYLTTFNLLD